MGGVPVRKRATPATGWKVGPMSNWSACPNHPQMGWRICSSRIPAHVQVARRSGTGVDVFVGAADRQVDAGRVELDRHGAGAVAQVPDHQAPGRVAGGGDAGQIQPGGRPVVDVGETHQGGAFVQGGRQLVRVDAADGIRLQQPQLATPGLGQPGQHEAVGREVVDVAEDDVPAGAQG